MALPTTGSKKRFQCYLSNRSSTTCDLDSTVPIVQVCNVLLRLQAEAQKQLTMKMEAMFQERLWGISFPALERCQFKIWGQYLLRVAKMHHLKSMPYIIHINYRCIACTHTHIYIWHICIYSSVCSYTVRTRTHTHTFTYIYTYKQTCICRNR